MIPLPDIQKLADDIGARFAAEKIVLFGSHSNGTAQANSDVDLLIVMDFQGRAIDQGLSIWSAVRPKFAVDLILLRPAELVKRYEEFDPLVREALDRGRVLYDRSRARVAG